MDIIQSLRGNVHFVPYVRVETNVRTGDLQMENEKTKGEMQKGNFQSSACRLDVEKIIIIGAISIFEIHFQGSTTTSRYPKRNFRNSACRFTVERSIPT